MYIVNITFIDSWKPENSCDSHYCDICCVVVIWNQIHSICEVCLYIPPHLKFIRKIQWQEIGWVSVQFSSVAQPCPTVCDPMNCSTPGLPVHHQLPEFTQTRIHWVSDAIQQVTINGQLDWLMDYVEWANNTLIIVFYLRHHFMWRVSFNTPRNPMRYQLIFLLNTPP